VVLLKTIADHPDFQLSHLFGKSLHRAF
jgi:hypothetical protein